MTKRSPLTIGTSTLTQGDPMFPHESDLIAQTGILNVGLPVPVGWRVMTGNERVSKLARVAFRHEIENEMAAQERVR